MASSVLDDIDSECLISAVELRPEIWDSTNEHFRNRELKERAWTEIAATFIQNFVQFENEDINTLIAKLQKRWKTVRDAFKRSRAKGGVTKTETKKQPKYNENLKFLEKNMDMNSSETFYIATGQTLQEALEQSDVEDEEFQLQVQPKTEIAEKKRAPKKIVYEESPVKHCVAKYEGDKCFLDSLLPTLQTFNEEQRLQFRIEVLNALQRVKNLFPQQTTPSRGPMKSFVLTPEGELKEEKKRPTTAAERMRKMRERRKRSAGLLGKNASPLASAQDTTKIGESASTSNCVGRDISGAGNSQQNSKRMKLEDETAVKDTKDGPVDSVILIWTELLGYKLQEFDMLTRECLMNETDNNVFKAKIKMMRQTSHRSPMGCNTSCEHPYNMEVRYVDISNVNEADPQDQMINSTPLTTSRARVVNKCEIVYVDPPGSI